jgi:hypothetical protein
MPTTVPIDTSEHRPLGLVERVCPCVAMGLIVYLYYKGHWKVATGLVIALALFLVSMPILLLASMGATYRKNMSE